MTRRSSLPWFAFLFSTGLIVGGSAASAQSAAQAAAPPVAPPNVEEPTSAPASMPVTANSQGPMRCEVIAVLESRYRFFDPTLAQQRPPELKFQLRVAGADVTKIARYGNFILDEVTDDTGASLVDPARVTEAARKQTRLSSQTPDRLAESGLISVADAKASSRGSKVLKTVKGSIKIVYAEGVDEVTILNPLQFVGAPIDDPRLKAAGIEMVIAAVDALEPAYEPKKGLTIKVKTGEERVRSIEFFDAWMKNIRHRPQPVMTKDQTEFAQYRLLGGELDEKSQMVIKIFKNPREETIPFDFKNVELP